jgi:hypothetical protein
MGIVEWFWPALAERRRWREEEQVWLQSGHFPRRIVRVYRSRPQRHRDARRLRRLGYDVHFEATSGLQSDTWRWHVTYDHRRPPR